MGCLGRSVVLFSVSAVSSVRLLVGPRSRSPTGSIGRSWSAPASLSSARSWRSYCSPRGTAASSRYPPAAATRLPHPPPADAPPRARRARGFTASRIFAEPVAQQRERFQPSACGNESNSHTPSHPCASGRDPGSDARRTARPRGRGSSRSGSVPHVPPFEEHQQLDRRIPSPLLCRHDGHLGVAARAPATRGQHSFRGTIASALGTVRTGRSEWRPGARERRPGPGECSRAKQLQA
jgi:hypothetical protein